MGTKREERIENFVGGKRSTTSKKKYKNHSSMSFFQISILQHIFSILLAILSHLIFVMMITL